MIIYTLENYIFDFETILIQYACNFFFLLHIQTRKVVNPCVSRNKYMLYNLARTKKRDEKK